MNTTCEELLDVKKQTAIWGKWMKEIYQRKMKANWSNLIIISSDWENANLNICEMTAASEGSPCCLGEETDIYLVSRMRPGPVEWQSFAWNGLPSETRSHLYTQSASSPGNSLCYLSTLSSDVFSSGVPSLGLRRESPLPCTHYFVVLLFIYPWWLLTIFLLLYLSVCGSPKRL